MKRADLMKIDEADHLLDIAERRLKSGDAPGATEALHQARVKLAAFVAVASVMKDGKL